MAFLLINRRASLLLLVGLFFVSTTYVTIAGRFLVKRESTHREDAVEASASHSMAPMVASVKNIENVTEALERLFEYFPLENPRRRPPNHKKAPPLQAAPKKQAKTAPEAEPPKRPSSGEASGNASFLDFAIIGFAKTGTTFLQSTWFAAHNEIRMPSEECRFMSREGGNALVVDLMQSLRTSESNTTIYGYKNPQDINRPRSLLHFRDYFPETRLIIGLRHPILWFQSLYNYRIHRGAQLPSAETLVGPCRAEIMDVCTDMANFHASLAGLGLTDGKSAREKQLLSTKLKVRRGLRPPLPNPIFLYDQAQLDASQDAQVSEALRQDLSAFLGLQTPLPPLTWSYRTHTNFTLTICEARYFPLRQELLRIGKAAGSWILEFFLDQPTVQVSSRDAFESFVEDWARDPCSKP